MTFIEKLTQDFGYNEPIMVNEVEYENYDSQAIYRELSRLCQKGLAVRFDTGIYYIPEITEVGTAYFNPTKIIEKKFIQNNDTTFGYYAGRYLQLKLGISQIRPGTIEIYTNGESRDSHKLKIGKQRILLHKPRTKIDKYNAGVLSFLELMNGIDIEDLDEYKKKLLADYINEHHITKRKITEHIKYFPNKTCRNLIESEVIYSVKL